MPTYEYICEKCGHQFELFQSMSEPPLEACTKAHCKLKRWGKGRVKRSISGGAGLIFKGSGFYITDYRSDKYKEAAKKEASNAKTPTPKTDSTSSPSPKPEPKPAPPKSAAAA
jgi:putative FmdB family regulatory protein